MNTAYIFVRICIGLLSLFIASQAYCFPFVIVENWKYTKNEIDHANNDWDGHINDLSFTNAERSTSATASGWVWAEDEIDGDSWAEGYMNFSFNFTLLGYLDVWLADEFTGTLSLGDDDNNNYAFANTSAAIYQTSTGEAVATLPSRNKKKTEQGSWDYNESESFADHAFTLPTGNYTYKGSLHIKASVDEVSIFDQWDDRMRSDFSYTVKMKLDRLPEPSTLLLLPLGVIAIIGLRKLASVASS